MNITKTVNGDQLNIALEGRLDTGTAPELEVKLKEVAPQTQNLYLNMKDVQYVSSSGLRVILLAHKLMLPTGGKMIIKQPSSFCKQVLVATGMDSILSIE